jgi:hypothetical protein
MIDHTHLKVNLGLEFVKDKLNRPGRQPVDIDRLALRQVALCQTTNSPPTGVPSRCMP